EVPLAVTLKQVQEMPSTVTTLRGDVPQGVSEMVLKLLAKQPRLRYQNAAQLIQAIDRLQNASAHPSRTTLFNFARAQLTGKRSKLALGIIGAGVLASVVVAVVIGSAAGASEASATPTVNPDNPALPATVPAATARPTLAPPTEAPPIVAPSPTPSPQLTVTNDTVNVRSGPGTLYLRLGEVKKGQVINVVGRNDDGSWLQIEFTSATGGKAWVALRDRDIELVQPNDAAKSVLVVVVPSPPVQLPAVQCANPNAALITSPQQGQTISRELVVFGTADIPEAGYGKVEILKSGSRWDFVSEFRQDRLSVSELGRIRPAEFSSLSSGVLRVRVVTVDRLGQEIAKCQISVMVDN
ncbi:MAG: SH3 domain-containing protein, partial [Anaerolineae bacterium]|nr:SH3 domain-containing protein [Anaerolineae bacterium]